MSGLVSARVAEREAHIVVGPGRPSWEEFAARALYHDLTAASVALARAARREAGLR